MHLYYLKKTTCPFIVRIPKNTAELDLKMNIVIINYFLKIKLCLFFLISFFFTSCSFHYDKGIQLEKEDRWEEAAIEYRIASIENPENLKVQEALKRVNLKVANENIQTYKKYLKNNQYRKAYPRLKAALSQNPQLSEARKEMGKWWHLLITGKVEFEFNKLSSNLRLADEMVLQVKINSHTGKILTGNISSENGIFFIEDVIYKTNAMQLAEYTINAIGLKIKRKSSIGFIQNEFKNFVNFREISPIEVRGLMGREILKEPQHVLKHRPNLLTENEDLKSWYPPDLLTYELEFSEDSVRVISKSNRNEFAPLVLYINSSERLVNLDFGVYQLRMNESQRKWSILRKYFRKLEDDYYLTISSNLALNQYFFYDRVFRFIQ